MMSVRSKFVSNKSVRLPNLPLKFKIMLSEYKSYLRCLKAITEQYSMSFKKYENIALSIRLTIASNNSVN